MIGIRYKDPSAKLDYTIDWAQWLRTDTLATSAWTSSPAGLTLSNEGRSQADTVVWIDGGVNGTTYTITNTITTTNGRRDERSFQLTIQNQ